MSCIKRFQKIIHVDFDAFFVSLEIRDKPWLSGNPVAVGGMPSQRGVISTCNYQARTLGVRSAMASAHALKICPELQILPPRFSVYNEASQISRTIFRKYTELVEPLSLDEAYLDVGESQHYQGSATLIAEAIQKEIFNQLQVTASAGVAPNMFLAKIASDWNKPNGIFVITPNEVDAFIYHLPIEKIHGVGPVISEKLQKQGISTCGELRELSLSMLKLLFGSFGVNLWHLCRGQDERQVQTNRRRKSLSVEHTLAQDLSINAKVDMLIDHLTAQLYQRLDKLKGEYKPIQRFVKIKFSNFTQTTLTEPINHLPSTQHFMRLALQARTRNNLPIRLLGIGVKLLDLKMSGYKSQLQLPFANV